MKIVLRQAVETDHAFIYATYIRRRWFSEDNTTTLKRSTWSQLQHNRIEKILANQGAVVACLAEDPDVIVGYALDDSGKPWAYVKLAWRSPGLGIKDKLLKAVQV